MAAAWCNDRVPFARVATTRPPAAWFHGIALDLATVYAEGLRQLGIRVFEVPVEPFLQGDLGRIADLKHDLLEFRPELAIGLSHGSYALICRMPPGRDGYRPNFFTEVLDLPTVCLWDHAPLELADQLLGPLPESAAESRPGALAALRRVLLHPRLIHWSRDHGQSRVMAALGFADARRIVHVPAPALPARTPDDGAHVRRERVGFIGHVYQQPASWAPEVQELLATLPPALAAHGGLWGELTRRIDALPAQQRERLKLSADDTFFWRVAHRFIVHDAQTAARLGALGAAGVPVHCLGNIDLGKAGVPRNLRGAGGRIPFRQVPAALAQQAITLDVLGPGFIEGYSHKPVMGFAAGGFVLLNRVQGFIDSFGSAGEAASWSDHDELAGKIDRYLANPALRQEIGDAIRAEISQRHLLSHALLRVLAAAADLRGGAPRPQRPAVAAGRSLLTRWRTHPHWDGSALRETAAGPLVTCGGVPWSYAAELPLDETEAARGCLWLRLHVRAGQVVASVIPVGQQHVLHQVLIGATHSGPTDVEIPLRWPLSVSVILRNTVEAGSEVLLYATELCDEPADPRAPLPPANAA